MTKESYLTSHTTTLGAYLSPYKAFLSLYTYHGSL